MKIISDSRIRHIVSIGQNNRLPSHTEFKNAEYEWTALNDFSDRWCWLVGCFGFNGPLRQYFSLYSKEWEKEEKKDR